jgi:hypothetical protein
MHLFSLRVLSVMCIVYIRVFVGAGVAIQVQLSKGKAF